MSSQLSPVPGHVPADRVFDVDIYGDPDLKVDIHAKMARYHQKYPDLFYTPRSGGYWVVTRQSLISQVLMDTQNFSSRQSQIPPVVPPMPILVPLNLDPPAHLPFRKALMHYFGPSKIAAMEARIRAQAAMLIDDVASKDTFEFMRSIGAGLPVTVFMEMMGLPLERFDEFRDLVCEYFSVLPDPRRRVLHQRVEDEMDALIEERQHERREDLMSWLLDEKVEGRNMTLSELRSIAVLVFLAGLDTVANAAVFMFYYLAQAPELQRQLVENPDIIPDFVDESLRMYGVANVARQVLRDVEVDGITLKKDEMVFCMLSLTGRDDRVVPDPDVFDINRPTHPHMMFGRGVHMCAGQSMAQLELRVLMQEWVKRISKFSLTPGYQVEFRSWQVMGLSKLSLAIDERRD